MKLKYSIFTLVLAALGWFGCSTETEPGDFVQSPGYRSGHVNDGFTLTPLLAELAGL